MSIEKRTLSSLLNQAFVNELVKNDKTKMNTEEEIIEKYENIIKNDNRYKDKNYFIYWLTNACAQFIDQRCDFKIRRSSSK